MIQGSWELYLIQATETRQSDPEIVRIDPQGKRESYKRSVCKTIGTGKEELNS